MLKMRTLKDYLELSKPRITFFCVIMTAGGMVLAPGNLTPFCFFITLLGSTLSVASANAFNMIYERKSDQLMKRTRMRPLANGRMSATKAACFAFLLGVLGIVLVAVWINLLTSLLCFLAILSYSLIYTPLKFKTPLALVVGAFPGAVPPLLGWTAVTGSITAAGLALFAVLFAWQMPHFIAIAISHKDDYARAGIRVVSAVRGEKIARIQAFLWSMVLFGTSLLLVPMKLGGILYLVAAVALGLWFLFLSLKGLQKHVPPNWPRKFFLASLLYLPGIVLALVSDRFFSFFTGI